MKKILALGAALCAALSFAPRSSAQMAVDSLTGPLTTNEISAFKTYLAGRTIATNNSGNAWLFGTTGHECAALGRMYEATGDVAILDRMIQYADTALAGRNDPVTGVVMWTGNRELCWPNSFTAPVYTSCESGEVAGHILHCARLILQTPSLWNTTVAVGDSHGYGATYKARAQTYLTECDRTIDTFIIPIWVSAANSNHIYAPANWNGDGGPNGGPVAWNRISMFLAALQRSAECHEILGDDPTRVANQDAIVSSNIQWFLSKAVPYTAGGFACYNWYYRADTTTKKEEVWEQHGALDIRMLWESYNRGIGLSKAEMTKFANTLQYSVWTGSVFHGLFDGTDGTFGTKTYTKGEYIDLADFIPAVYTTVATADQSHTTDTSMIGPILWMKNRIYQKFAVASLTPAQTVTAGAAPATYSIAVSPLGGFSGNVTLAASGLPTGAGANFSPATIGGASGTSTLTLSTVSTTPAGNYTLTITGTNASTTHSDTAALTVNPGSVLAPSFNPAAGYYTSSPSVTLASATSGASIRYTTNGTTPTSTTGTLYTAPVGLGATATLKAIAYKSGMLDSAVTSGDYTVTGGGPITLEAEALAPVGSGATVSTASDASASGGVVQYLNSTGTGQSMTLTTPVLQAGTYQVQLRYKTNATRGQHTVSIDGTQLGGTVDQYAASAAYTSVTLGTRTFATTATHAVVLAVTGKNASSTGYLLSVDTLTFTPQVAQAAAPTFNPAGGTYSTTQSVTLSSTTSGASIRYTTDGSTPTSTTGTLYSAALSVPVTTTIKAIAYKSGLTDSTVSTATYMIVPALTGADIGSPPLAGSTSLSGTTFTLNGCGSDMYGTADQFHYASKSASGDTTIVARVVSQTNTNNWAKSGVMIRESTAAGASFVDVLVTPANGIDMQYRNGTGTSAVDLARISSLVAPYWVKLVRSGNTFTGYCSPDGTTWTTVGTISVTMTTAVRTGLAVCSHNTASLNTSTFDKVSAP
jgi:hypothetical protein